MHENQITELIIGKAIEVHKTLGPGLLESAYQECLKYELQQAGLKVETEKPMPIQYKEITINHGYRLDLLVENKVIIELKTTETLTDIHKAQLLTYLKISNHKVGLLINFNTLTLKDGIKRYVNNL